MEGSDDVETGGTGSRLKGMGMDELVTKLMTREDSSPHPPYKDDRNTFHTALYFIGSLTRHFLTEILSTPSPILFNFI